MVSKTSNSEENSVVIEEEAVKKAHIIRRLYDWVLSWADSTHGTTALFVIAFTESSFFIVPPDILLIALCISRQKKAFRYALVCSVGSVLGGVLGYVIGFKFFDIIGIKILEFYSAMDHYEYVKTIFNDYGAWGVAVAGFTFIPYKVFTIAAGVFKLNFVSFTIASLLSRSARFFLVSALIYKFGAPVKSFIDKYFNLLCIIFIILLILGFYLIKIAFK
jgi:membrane protein YqaA with SNARE-associated domain